MSFHLINDWLILGPFRAGEMAEWFSAGYFSPNLVVKQGSDECFVPLGT